VTVGVAKHFRLLAGAGPPFVANFVGQVAASGSVIRARYVGSGDNRDFLLRLVMDEPRECARYALPSYAHVAKAVGREATIASERIDVVLTDLPPFWQMLTPQRAQYRFPAWVRQELALPPRGSEWVLPRAVEREAARLARRYEYTLDFVTDEISQRRFFHDLYRPYVLQRFGSGAIVVTERDFLARARSCTLARLHEKGRWTAGLLLERRGTTLRFGWFGALGDPPPPGASDVLDVGCIRRAHSDGVRRVLLGHSRPSLTDGVVRYKQKLGASLCAVRYPQAHLGITVDGGQRSVFDRLNGRQLVAIRHGRPSILQAS
jgi:hypothetical protein